MSTEELLQLADSGADFASPPLGHSVQPQQQQHDDTMEATSLAEIAADMESEAQVEAEVTAEAAAAASAHAEAEAEAQEEEESDEVTEVTEEEEAAETAVKPAAAASEAESVAPNLGESIDAAVRRLKNHRTEIVKLEAAIAQQNSAFAPYAKAQASPAMVGMSTSSGANYWERNVRALKSARTVSAGAAAAGLTITDARCVVCQFVVQQTQGLLAGKPLTSGGATSGGKRAAAAEHAARAPRVSTFIELGVDVDEASFMELDASVSALSGAGLEAMLAAEMESTTALAAAAETFLSAADSAMQHSASESMRAHYGRRALPSRSVHSGANLRNVNAPSYPRQLNDHGFEEVTRNRHADILAFRPRQARFSKKDLEAQEEKWAATRATYQKLYSDVYASLESLCTKKMPQAYAAYCHDMLRDYRYIAQGIQYGDKAASICMNGNWCDRQSYIRNAVHAYFVRENGDSP